MRTIRALSAAWDKFELFVGGLFLTAAVVLIVWEIVGRSVFSHSMVGADEIAAYAVIWSVFFTASMAVKKNLHVRIDVIFTVVPPAAARYIDMVGTVLSAMFTAYLAWSGLALVRESLMLGEVTMTMLRLHLWIPHLIVPIGGVLLTVRLVQRFVALATQRKDDGEPTPLAANHSI